MNKKLLTLFCLITCFKISSNVEILDRVSVIVDDGIIMESQIQTKTNEVIARYQNQNIPLPDKNTLRNEIIEKLILDELQLQMARRAGIRIGDEELNRAFIRIAANNNMTIEEFLSSLKNQGNSYESIREDVRSEMLIQRVQQGRVGSEINITDLEFQAFLQNDESIKQVQPDILLGQILVSSEQIANEIIKKINDGQDFQELAKSSSISASSAKGGLLDWKKELEMPNLFADAIKNKDKGWVSGPLKSGAGFHIIKLIDKRGEFVEYQDQWEVRHILLMPSTIRDSKKTESELNDIRNKVLSGESFGDLAIEHSEDTGSSSNGGNLGWNGIGVFDPEFEKMMLNTEPGEISEVFESQFGFHFLEVLGKRNKDVTDENIEDHAYAMLFSRKYDEELENTLRSMRAEAYVEIKELD